VPRNVYETLFLLNSNHYSRDPGGVSSAVNTLFEDAGGTVLASRLWQEQKLAYPINGQQKGTYWLTYAELDSDKLTEFNRACQLSEPVLRHLTLKVEPRLVEPMLAHARGEASLPRPDVSAIEVDDEQRVGV
jgi:small subunit ribosomal protein S6